MDEIPYTDSHGRVFKYGEFFPYDMSPFGINETNALDYFKVSEEEAEKFGYPWTKKEKANYNITIESKDLPNSILDVGDEIVDEIIGCPNKGMETNQCTSAYKITPDELFFYRAKKLPLPRFCPNCRHYERINYRNQPRYYDRTCSNDCGRTFKTTYTPESTKKIFCEECYNKEIY